MSRSDNPTLTNERTVIEAVRKQLAGLHPGGVTLDVVLDGIRQDQDWWYVPVRPSSEPTKRYEYYEALAKAETELQKSEGLTVLLVPVLPDQSGGQSPPEGPLTLRAGN